MRKVVLSVIAAAVTAAPAAAQICTGFPTVDGQTAITAGLGFPDGGKTYSVAGAVDLTGPLSVNGGVAIATADGVDEKAYEFGANVAYQLPGLSFSACPVAGLSYMTLSSDEGDGEFNVLNVPIGFGVGQSFAAGNNASVGLFAIPGVVISRSSLSGGGVDISDTETYFAANLGALFQTGPFFAGASVGITSQDESDALFGINLGMVFGNR